MGMVSKLAKGCVTEVGISANGREEIKEHDDCFWMILLSSASVLFVLAQLDPRPDLLSLFSCAKITHERRVHEKASFPRHLGDG